MKRLFIIILIILFFAACNENQTSEPVSQTRLEKENRELKEEIAKRDRFIKTAMKIIREVDESLEQVNNTHITLIEESHEMKTNQKARWKEIGSHMLNEIETMNEYLKKSKNKILSLETQLSDYKKKFNDFNLIVRSLKNAILQKQEAIDSLKKEIKQHMEKIAELRKEISAKDETIYEQDQIIGTQEEMIAGISSKLNTRYFIIGTKRRLKQEGIIQKKGGVLGMGTTWVLSPSLKNCKFKCIDKSHPTIIVGAKVKQILPERDKRSYDIANIKDGTASVLVIYKPDIFWQSRYLAIII